MPALVKEIRLIHADIKSNHNKYWYGRLFDNEDVETEWGRVGVTKDSKLFEGAGESFLLRKEKEKLKKGYTPARVLAGTSDGKVTPVNNLSHIAYQELSKGNPELNKLMDRLVTANVHKITTQTNITYNSSSGLFQTPLGIVTPDAINEARNLLVEIKKALLSKSRRFRVDGREVTLPEMVSDYLRIIPQNVGMKFKVDSIFPNTSAVQQQSDILDSLEASYKSVTFAPKDSSKQERVFEVDLNILPPGAEYDRLVKFYRDSMKAAHGYGHIKIKRIFSVKVYEMDRAYRKDLGNNTEVFHGTSQANLLSILKVGLKTSPPSTAYIAGKMFGNGIYGAIHSSKSLGYTYGRWGGSTAESGWLFICDFAMGKIDYPHGSVRQPTSGFDSVWAKSDKCGIYHDELIVYKDNQVNIKYLIECE